MKFGKTERRKPLSILIYGQDGTGKTPTVIYLAKKFGPCAAVDADGGLAPYVEPGDESIQYAEGDNPVAVRKLLEELSAQPGDFKMLAIDPISTIYDSCIRLTEQYARSKVRGPTDDFQTYTNIRSWGTIKGLNGDIMRLIRNIGMPTIVTAREANRWENDKIVDVRPAGDKTLGHEFSLSIRLSQEVPGGPRLAVVKRDRLMKMPKMLQGAGDDPLFLARAIEEVYGEWLGGQAVPVEQANSDVVQEILNLTRNLRIPYGKILDRIGDLFGKSDLNSLSPVEAGEILEPLRDSWEAHQLQTNNQQED